MTSARPNPAFVIGYLRDVRFGDDIIDYLQRIDATLAPYGGRFLVHTSRLVPLEGTWDGDVVIIAFPDRVAAREWYDSPAYQALVPLRTDNSDSIVALLEGVAAGHQATDGLATLLAQA